MIDKIITAIEFAAFRNISKKVDTDKVNESIDLAQQSDLQDMLGGFYYDVLKNKDESKYSDLMDGSEFTYCDEIFQHAGIKALLADLTYSRFIYMINVNLTPFGAQSKFTEDSNGIDRNHIKDLSGQAKFDGGVKFKIIQKYLLSEPELFSRYCSGQNVNTSQFTQKISKL